MSSTSLTISDQGLKNFSRKTNSYEHVTLLASKYFGTIKALVLICVAWTITNPKGCECCHYTYIYIFKLNVLNHFKCCWPIKWRSLLPPCGHDWVHLYWEVHFPWTLAVTEAGLQNGHRNTKSQSLTTTYRSRYYYISIL